MKKLLEGIMFYIITFSAAYLAYWFCNLLAPVIMQNRDFPYFSFLIGAIMGSIAGAGFVLLSKDK